MSELEKAFLELRSTNTKYSIKVLELEQENARLREALEFYADGASWQSYNANDDVPMRYDREDAHSVCGMRARQALKENLC